MSAVIEILAAVLNYGLRLLVMVFDLLLLYWTIFKWKRRDLFIQSMLWLLLISIVIDTAQEISEDIEDEFT